MRGTLKWIIGTIITAQARAVLRKYKPRIIAVTGSVGKTSTKDAIYAALCEKAFIRKSDKSFNSEIGIPLTILGVPNGWDNPIRWLQNIIDGFFLILFKSHYPEWLVLEVGADRPGDIRSVAAWLPVDIAVITRLPETPVHVEYFESPEQVVEEKAALISALKPGGTLVLFGDDERVRALATRTHENPVIMFGFGNANGVRAENTGLFTDASGRPIGMRAHVAAGDQWGDIQIQGTVGEHLIMPQLAAVAVGASLGLTVAELCESITRNYVPPPGRMRLLAGLKGTLIIDDTYNASPAAVAAALETLASIPGKRHIAALGDMLELGTFSVGEHKKIGWAAAKAAQILITVGIRARDIAGAALDTGMPDGNIFQYEDSIRAGAELQNMLLPGDVVLVKGSQSVRMERVVEEIMAEPARATELLVRQEEEWQKR